MKPHYQDDLDAYNAAIARRLRNGVDDYGDRSFAAAPTALIGEIQEELEDVAGWAFLLWQRMAKLKRQLSKASQPADEGMVEL